MTELLTAAQMRALEHAAIERDAVTGLELMERAGHGVVEAIFQKWPELKATSHRATVICGPGNNGGDGFVVARLLTEWGWNVEVFLYGNSDELPPDARTNYKRWIRLGSTTDLENFAVLSEAETTGAQDPSLGGDPLIVDAVFGTGASRPVGGHLAEVLEHVARIASNGRTRVVAVDIPSGICADSGKSLGKAAGANLTVSFHRPKLGHFLQDGAVRSGHVVTADIGLDQRAPGRDREVPGDPTHLIESTSQVAKDPAHHKYDHGHAVVLAGPPGYGGAARLAARGALRIGTGLVTVACPPPALPENAARLDAIMLRPVADAGDLKDLLNDERLNAVCLGPGLGVGARTRDLVAVALQRPEDITRAVVLDADALTSFQEEPKALFALLHERSVLTPHAGEFARLFPEIAKELNGPATRGPAYSKVDAARDAAAQAGCTILFKGPDTVIAAPDGTASINSARHNRSAPWLATAGSGDVLAGFVTGLLARGFAPLDAAATAAWLHVECALSFGPALIAEDIPEELPKVLRALGA